MLRKIGISRCLRRSTLTSCNPSLQTIRYKSVTVEYDKVHVDYYSSGEEKDHQSRLRKRLADVLTQGVNSQVKRAYTFPVTGRLSDAIAHLSEYETACAIAVNDSGTIEGLFTARDIIRYIAAELKKGRNKNGNNKMGSIATTGANTREIDHMKALNNQIMESDIKQLITPSDKLVYCTPNDTVRETRKIMFQYRVRHIPVVDGNEVIGIVNAADLSDATFSVESMGGKKAWMEYKGTMGLPENTRYSFDPQGKHASSDVQSLSYDGSLDHQWNLPDEQQSQFNMHEQEKQPLYQVHTAAYSMPHPFKSHDGVANSRRDYGPHEYCNDDSLCEDAHFIKSVGGTYKKKGMNPGNPTTTKKEDSKLTYMCVADGVGSWRKYDVDPKLFAHKLVQNALEVIESDEVQREMMTEDSPDHFSLFEPEPIHPLDVIMDAYSHTRQEKVIGSSTICLASIDTHTNQLTFSNLGDCGLLLLRHLDSETAGYMRERNLPRHMRKNDLRIAFLSQQQLKSFNYPYQLGYSELDVHQGTFEGPSDATTFSMPLEPGDVVLMATDGLFDNIDLEELVESVSTWERKYYDPINVSISLSPDKEKEALQELSTSLVHKARELSLDDSRDSPFALLAKDNDIMWSGGMPDDTTIVVARVASPMLNKAGESDIGV